MREKQQPNRYETGQSDPEILDLINQSLSELGGSGTYKNVPAIKKETLATLKGKKILVIDDSAEAIAAILPNLIAATESRIAVCHFKPSNLGDQLGHLCSQIESYEPDIILFGYDLGHSSKKRGELQIDGARLVRSSALNCPHSLLIGISSDAEGNDKIRQKGSHGSIEKPLLYSEGGADSLAEYVRSHEAFSKRARLIESGKLSFFNGLVLDPMPDGTFKYGGIDLPEDLYDRKFRAQAVEDSIVTLSEFIKWDEQLIKLCGVEQDNRGEASVAFAQYLREQVAKLDSPFRQYCQIAGELNYINHRHRIPLDIEGNIKIDFTYRRLGLLSQLTGCIPWQLRSSGEVTAAAASEDDFALLVEFRSKSPFGERGIITSEKLYQLSDVGGYHYLSLTPEGLPFHRCTTSRLGGRAFFDGTHLMAHPLFTTCAPDVVFFKGGYMVNSTDCTLVNGVLYPLINSNDSTTVPNGSISSYATRQAYLSNIAVANQLEFLEGQVVRLGETEFHPIGIFRPSQISLQTNGFSRYEWSDFIEM